MLGLKWIKLLERLQMLATLRLKQQQQQKQLPVPLTL